MRHKVLFTGGGGSAAQSIHDQWAGRYELYFADAVPESIPPSIPADRRVAIPFARDPDFAPALARACAARGIAAIVPGVDEELPILARLHGAPGWPAILLPGAEFVALMLDKRACAEAILAADLDAPRTLPLARAAEIGFPLIAKPRAGRGSRGVMRLDRPAQVDAYLALQGGDPDDFIAQELLAGQEYTVLVAADAAGALQATIPVLVHEKRGVTLRARTDAAPAVLDYAARFQAVFRPSGVYNIQCMLTPEGRVAPFEVNPRVSTTFVLGVATGFDPVAALLDPAAAGAGVFTPQGVWALQRSWRSDITRIE